MIIHSVKLVNYKSIGDYDGNEIIIEPKVTAIIGKNESGKSNILEGLSQIRFTERNQRAFLDNDRNRKASNDAPYFVQLVLKHSSIEIERGASCDTVIHIDKSNYIATGGIVKYYNRNIKSSIDKLRIFLDKEGINPFRLTGQDYNNYRALVNETMKDDMYNFYCLNSYVTICMNKVNYIKQDAQEEYKQIIEEVTAMWNEFVNLFPTFFYRKNNKALKSTYNYDEIAKELGNPAYNQDSLLRNLIKILGITNEEFILASKSGNEPQQISSRRKINRLIAQKINKEFQKFYTTEKLILCIEFNGGNIVFMVNCEEGEALLLSERSNGLKWYLNLFIDILSCNLLGKNTVFLFDEPGTSLHVNAQRELLNLFNHLTASGNQVIYTTHSPYMLDTENDGIHRIRAVIKNECEDTVIYKTAYDVRIAPESQSDTLTPIVRALGMSLLTTFGPAKGKLNIVTEGMSDYIYMCLMAKVLNVDLSKCNFIPAQGATNSVNIVKILHGWGCKYIALFDFDKEGVEEGGEQIRNFFNSNIGDNFLYIIDVTQDDVDRQVYKDKTKSKVIEDLITKNEIDNFCALHNVALPLGKPLIAKLLSNAVENGTYNLGDECINNFKELFKRLGL